MRVSPHAHLPRPVVQATGLIVCVGILLLTVAGCALPFGGSTSTIPRPTPTATPRPLTPEELAAQLVARMSLDDELGQLLIIQFTATTYTAQQAAIVRTVHPGGVVLYRYAMGTAQQVKDLLASGQQDSPVPMFTFLTLEGGSVDPLAQYLGPRPSPAAMAKAGEAFVGNAASKAANDLLSFGFNTDIAPNLMIANGSGAVSQSFGNTPDLVTTFGGDWLAGLQANGVVGCAGFFPGGGGASALAPYRTLIAPGQLQMIMSTTAVVPSVDPNLPAALSPGIITGLLRTELQFNGIAITDSLYQGDISTRFSLAQAAVMAIKAGNDMVIGPTSASAASAIVSALKAAIAAGNLSQQQVDASVTRILALKLRYHILAPTAVATTP